MKRLTRTLVGFSLGGLCALFTPPRGMAQDTEPSITNARVERLTIDGELSETLGRLAGETTSPRWIGYAVPAEPRGRSGCKGGSTTYRLENENNNHYSNSSDATPEERSVSVWIRIESGTIDKIRLISLDCVVDAAGVGVHWLSGVDPEGSQRWLETMTRSATSEDLRHQAVMAIAHHRGDSADARLESIATSDAEAEVREKAVFWMGAARGQRSFAALSRLAMASIGEDLAEKVVFAIHLSDVEGSTPKLIELARQHPSSEVREKALFWLAQKAGARAAAAIGEAALEDPDLEVKERAIFALSQLPPDEGIPVLIEMAETHRQPKIRKKAAFWLGQSGDPRAVRFFEKILLSR